MNLPASLPVPPYGVNTRGLKEPCSISITRWLYIRFFSFSLLLKAVSSFWFRWLFANGSNTIVMNCFLCLRFSFQLLISNIILKYQSLNKTACLRSSKIFTNQHFSLNANIYRHGWIEIAEKLLAKRNVRMLNQQDDKDKTPLHYACGEGHDTICELLLMEGATIER